MLEIRISGNKLQARTLKIKIHTFKYIFFDEAGDRSNKLGDIPGALQLEKQ